MGIHEYVNGDSGKTAFSYSNSYAVNDEVESAGDWRLRGLVEYQKVVMQKNVNANNAAHAVLFEAVNYVVLLHSVWYLCVCMLACKYACIYASVYDKIFVCDYSVWQDLRMWLYYVWMYMTDAYVCLSVCMYV